MWVLLPALLTVTMGWRWEREGVQIKSTVVTALLPPGSTLTFDTDESILRPNALFVFFSLRHSPSHLTSPLCGLTCTFSRSSPPPHSVFFLYPQGDSCMQKHCGSLSFKTPSLKIAPFFFFLPQSIFPKRWAGLVAWYDAAIPVLNLLRALVFVSQR